MSRKPDTASALASILRAKRGDDQADAISPSPAPPAVEPPEEEHPSPAPPVKASPRRASMVAKPVEPTAGKRNHPDYCQANAYVPKALRKAVDKALLDIDGLNYSTLVETLLSKWLKSRGVAE